MKTSKLFLGLIPLVMLFGCDKKENVHVGVDKYVQLLKSNKYIHSELPTFELEAIDGLLKYRNEKSTITIFPRNGLSSLYQPECMLGMYILWTIESIRVEATNSKLFGRFPSSNPVLRLRDLSEGLILIDSKEAHQAASNAYNSWWSMRGLTGADFNTWLMIDPLEGTKYAWH